MTSSRRTTLRFALFAVLALVQLYVPIAAIVRHEKTLKTGHVYKFRTAPVDPEDAFRGKFVALNFDAQTISGAAAEGSFTSRERVYAVVGTDSQGFARVTRVSSVKPESGDYFMAKLLYQRTIDPRDPTAPPPRAVDEDRRASDDATPSPQDVGSQEIQLRFPFDRYYMDEVKAPAAEIAYRDNSTRRARNAYVTVRVRDGYAALEELYIDGVPIREFLVRAKP